MHEQKQSLGNGSYAWFTYIVIADGVAATGIRSNWEAYYICRPRRAGSEGTISPQLQITCLATRSLREPQICPQHGAVGALLIFQNRAHPRERNKWSEATWFRECARTEHRSGGEAAAKERSGYLVLCEDFPAGFYFPARWRRAREIVSFDELPVAVRKTSSYNDSSGSSMIGPFNSRNTRAEASPARLFPSTHG